MSDTIRKQVNTYMITQMSDWPDALYSTVKAVTSMIGFSGGALADIVEVWLKYGNGEPMNYREFLAACAKEKRGDNT